MDLAIDHLLILRIHLQELKEKRLKHMKPLLEKHVCSNVSLHGDSASRFDFFGFFVGFSVVCGSVCGLKSKQALVCYRSIL